jgi:hypothetical protein
MKTEIRRVVDMNTHKVFKLIEITTDNNEAVFHGKLYTDSKRYKEPIDEEELLKEIESIPNLLKNS